MPVRMTRKYRCLSDPFISFVIANSSRASSESACVQKTVELSSAH